MGIKPMWPLRSSKLAQIEVDLQHFSDCEIPLKGINDPAHRHALAMQMIASLRRLDYTQIIKNRDISPDRRDPLSNMFDPERAAAYLARTGEIDEAIWLIFLATHFGQHGRHGWQMLRDVYSGLDTENWTWARVVGNPQKFKIWMQGNWKKIGGAFGNHRKYETLNPQSAASTSRVIDSFVQCFQPTPSVWFSVLVQAAGNDPHVLFDRAMDGLPIARFGRLAKFDFLALLGRLDLAPISPGSAYLSGATGPLRGARLLIDGDVHSKSRAKDLDIVLQQLDQKLGVGMQVMEDSICNWQKSPHQFKHFRG